MKILIVEDEIEILDILAQIAESSLPQATVLKAASLASAMGIFDKEKSIDLIISDENLGDGKGSEIYAQIEKNKLPIQFVLCSSLTPSEISILSDKKIFAHVVKPQIFGPFTEVLQKFDQWYKQNSQSSEDKPQSDESYCRVRLDSLVRLNVLTSDLFVRLSEKKYVKVLNSGDLFGEGDFHHYQDKSIEYMYIRKEDAPSFFSKLAQSILSILSAEKLSDEGMVNLQVAFHSVIHDTIQFFGMSQEVQSLIALNLKTAVKAVLHHPELADLLKKMRISPDSYINTHSVAVNYACGYLLSLMSWKSETANYKISLAALMHDILLDNHELAAIQSLDELEKNKQKFTAEEIKSYQNHPINAANLIRGLENMPPDVDSIILQHHERPDGNGFPHKLSGLRISPLSALFIISHDLIREKAAKKIDHPKEFFEKNHQTYNTGSFKKIIKEVMLALKIA